MAELAGKVTKNQVMGKRRKGSKWENNMFRGKRKNGTNGGGGGNKLKTKRLCLFFSLSRQDKTRITLARVVKQRCFLKLFFPGVHFLQLLRGCSLSRAGREEAQWT